ncbi:hypothetical protein P171DRAFT_119013 [Karstenula rhodostoma CBS 690.94]|uniref:Uncharacterized protein n=1 Tax=Karstenula rhodostoma CBS 690.94 TaxID=1392251 RepID=A0A9P4PBU1_9PLEO|nr:hypothetical protein P171DRAFT_119013 [Karstenula rhodostoma CBS 690.94]
MAQSLTESTAKLVSHQQSHEHVDKATLPSQQRLKGRSAAQSWDGRISTTFAPPTARLATQIRVLLFAPTLAISYCSEPTAPSTLVSTRAVAHSEHARARCFLSRRSVRDSTALPFGSISAWADGGGEDRSPQAARLRLHWGRRLGFARGLEPASSTSSIFSRIAMWAGAVLTRRTERRKTR